MAKRKIEVFVKVENQKEFENIVNNNSDALICAEIYCSFSGHCTALNNLFIKIKLDWSNGRMILLKVPADEIDKFERFRGQSQPVYLFIFRNRITKQFRGVDAIRFAEVAKKEIALHKREQAGEVVDRQTYGLDEASQEELEWQATVISERAEELAFHEGHRAARQAARKRRRAELMVPHLRHLNFVLFWPHAKHAHPELYERWDLHNIIMVGREDLELTEDKAKDILYAGDAPFNEASLSSLLSGLSLAICFRILDTDKNFVSLVRKILYEELPRYDPEKSIKDQLPLKTAFDLYKTLSPTREEIWRRRREDKDRHINEIKEKRARRLSEMQRLARQAIEEAIVAKRAEKEHMKLELLKTGKLAELETLKQQTGDEEVDIAVPEELSDEEEEFIEETEDENEYFPPPGLPVPGFYAPPNDIAKANGLAVLFPNLVLEHVSPEPEFLPPHVLVMLEISKRYKAIEALYPYKSSIIHMGIFRATTPKKATHVAYSVKQYDFLNQSDEDLLKIAFMLSTKTDLPLLQLMDLNPMHVSRDSRAGEAECASLFPVYYCHEKEFEDFSGSNVKYTDKKTKGRLNNVGTKVK